MSDIVVDGRGIHITGAIEVGAPGVGIGGGGGLNFSDLFTRADGLLGNGWESGGATWTISGNKVINTPTRGADLITNGTFAVDANWTKGTDWTIAAGVAHHANGTIASLTQNNVLTSEQWYEIIWTLAAYSGTGTVRAQFGSTTNLDGAGQTVPATYHGVGRANGVTVGFRASAAAVVDVDNVSCKLLTLNTLFASQNFGRANVDVTVKPTVVANNRAGLVLNLDSVASPANFVAASHDGTNAYLSKCVAGVYTNLITAAATYSAGAPLRVVKSGTVYSLWYNGTQVGIDQSVSDISIVSNPRSGLFNVYEGNSLDDFAIVGV